MTKQEEALLLKHGIWLPQDWDGRFRWRIDAFQLTLLDRDGNELGGVGRSVTEDGSRFTISVLKELRDGERIMREIRNHERIQDAVLTLWACRGDALGALRQIPALERRAFREAVTSAF